MKGESSIKSNLIYQLIKKTLQTSYDWKKM